MGTLTNFGVPMGRGGGRGGILMPKVKNRFRVVVYNFGSLTAGIALTQQVMTAARPVANFNPTPVHSYNSISYYAGKAEWEAVEIKVRDDTANSVHKLVVTQMQRQMNFYEQTVPRAASAYKFEMLVDTMDGGNDMIIDSWYYEGCFIANVNYDTMDYSSADAMQITMSVRYDTVTNNLMPQVQHDDWDVFLGESGNMNPTPSVASFSQSIPQAGLSENSGAIDFPR